MIGKIYCPKGEVIFYKPRKEVAYLRKARKRHTCNECKKLIDKGEFYVEDNVSSVKRNRVGEGYVVWLVYRVCSSCWKAPLKWR